MRARAKARSRRTSHRVGWGRELVPGVVGRVREREALGERERGEWIPRPRRDAQELKCG